MPSWGRHHLIFAAFVSLLHANDAIKNPSVRGTQRERTNRLALNKVLQAERLAQIISEHHEVWTGSRGLKGKKGKTHDTSKASKKSKKKSKDSTSKGSHSYKTGKSRKKEEDKRSKSKDFDFSDCNTYSKEWLLDLAITCNDAITLAGCKCATASGLLADGTLGCAGHSASHQACPAECSVCQFCMVQSGCQDIYA